MDQEPNGLHSARLEMTREDRARAEVPDADDVMVRILDRRPDVAVKEHQRHLRLPDHRQQLAVLLPTVGAVLKRLENQSGDARLDHFPHQLERPIADCHDIDVGRVADNQLDVLQGRLQAHFLADARKDLREVTAGHDHADLLPRRRLHFGTGFLPTAGNIGAAPLLRADESPLPQFLDDLVHRLARHAEPPHQLPFAREAVVGGEVTRENLLGQDSFDLP